MVRNLFSGSLTIAKDAASGSAELKILAVGPLGLVATRVHAIKKDALDF
jgi:hypothetical protein